MTLKWYDPEKKIAAAVKAGLTACGLEVTYYAKIYAPHDEENLRRSINWRIKGNAVTIGTNVEYGIYQEFGTGRHVETGKFGDLTVSMRRRDSWWYKDEKTEEWIHTTGNRPHPYLRPAIDKVRSYHEQIFFKEFKRILK